MTFAPEAARGTSIGSLSSRQGRAHLPPALLSKHAGLKPPAVAQSTGATKRALAIERQAAANPGPFDALLATTRRQFF